MSSTSITSTSGVVLMVAIMPPPPLGSPTFIDMVSYSLKEFAGPQGRPQRTGGAALAAAGRAPPAPLPASTLTPPTR